MFFIFYCKKKTNEIWNMVIAPNKAFELNQMVQGKIKCVILHLILAKRPRSDKCVILNVDTFEETTSE